jgi:uncharacterized beta-barrel protein YwiB (DUF1934 family)
MKVIVEVTGVQTIDGEKNDSQIICEGTYQYTKEKAVIKYTQMDANAEDEYSTTIELSSSGMTMIKEGQFSSTMQFAPSMKYTGTYSTPFGCLNINVLTDYIDVYLDEDGGMIRLAYVLEMGNMVNSLNELCIKVKPKSE